jgi:tetratricopeptide (TPR) repeat protein
MMMRSAATLFALAMPLLAQAKAPTEHEAIFYKAFYLERAERDHANAMVLYEQFLAAAPDHKYAKMAAERQLDLLTRTGKSKEAQAFAEKHEKLLGKGAAAAAGEPAKPAGDAPRGEGRGEGRPPEGGRGEGRPPEGARPNPQERIAALEKQITEAKEAGDEAKVKELTTRLERMKQMAAGGGQGGRRAGGLFGTKKLAEMTAEELEQFKGGVERMGTFVERMKENPNATEEQIKTAETNYEALKKALDENKLEDAQKALDKLRELMQRRRNG